MKPSLREVKARIEFSDLCKKIEQKTTKHCCCECDTVQEIDSPKSEFDRDIYYLLMKRLARPAGKMMGFFSCL